MEAARVQWISPGGMHIPEQDGLMSGEPCLLVLRGGKSQLGQLLEFTPHLTHLQFVSNHHAEPLELSLAYVLWMRLLTPVHLQDAKTGQDFAEPMWQRLLKTVEIEFKSGEVLKGEVPALLQTETGWFFFLVKDTAEVFRYFIPHRGVKEVRLNGEVQPRLDVNPAPVREMQHPRLAALLKGQEQKYPFALEARFTRVFNTIMRLWDAPEELQAYFEELMVDKRGGRQGFPEDVAHDIFVLSMVYDDFLRQPSQPEDPWASETAQQELNDLGHQFSSQHFHQAVERNDMAAATLFLRAGMAVDTQGEVGWTPLMVATFNGNEEMAALLLQHGANPHAVDAAGYTPLHWAAANGFVAVTQTLLRKRVAVDACNRYGWTPLLQAAARGHVAVVQLLLEAGARATHADREGWTALHKAVANRHVAVAELLLRYGADVRAQHQSGVTPLSLAQQKGYTEIQTLMLHALAHPQVALGLQEEEGGIRYEPPPVLH